MANQQYLFSLFSKRAAQIKCTQSRYIFFAEIKQFHIKLLYTKLYFRKFEYTRKKRINAYLFDSSFERKNLKTVRDQKGTRGKKINFPSTLKLNGVEKHFFHSECKDFSVKKTFERYVIILLEKPFSIYFNLRNF